MGKLLVKSTVFVFSFCIVVNGYFMPRHCPPIRSSDSLIFSAAQQTAQATATSLSTEMSAVASSSHDDITSTQNEADLPPLNHHQTSSSHSAKQSSSQFDTELNIPQPTGGTSNSPPTIIPLAPPVSSVLRCPNGHEIKLEKVKNIRDLSTVHGSGIRPGRVYRTGYLSKATPEDIKVLRERLAFKTLIDLRSNKELLMDQHRNSEVYEGFDTYVWSRKGERLRSDIMASSAEKAEEARQRHFVSVIDESVYSRGVFRRLGKRKKAAALILLTGGAMKKRVSQRARNIFLYFINEKGLPLLNDLLLHYSKGALLRVLDLLSDPNRYPVALYCTAGKDRTGLIVLLVLASLGVSREAIVEDYVLSDTAYDDLNDEKALVGALEQNRLDPEKFLRAPRSVIDHTMTYINRRYGGVDSYLDRIGFGPEKRAKLRASLLTP